MGRAERRKAARREQEANRLQKQRDAVMNMARNERTIALVKNGITPDDLKRVADEMQERMDRQREEMQKVMDAQRSELEMTTMVSVLAASCLALKEEFRFGSERAIRYIERTYSIIIRCIDQPTLLQETLDKLGIEIDPSNPLEPVVRHR